MNHPNVLALLADENTNSWNPVVDGRRGGATTQQHGRRVNVESHESKHRSNVTSQDVSLANTGVNSALSMRQNQT